MAKLKLIKGLSYSGIISATKKKPYVEVDDEATVQAAVATGYFEVVDAEASQPVEEPETAEVLAEEPMQYGGKPLNEMNKSELETFAAYRDVDIKGANTKAAIIKKLRAALPASELEGDIYYGSPTMVELQDEIL